jgi:hypothetical protein
MSILQRLFSANALGGSFALQTDRPLEWLFVAASVLVLIGGLLALALRAPCRGLGPARLGAGLRAFTGLPGWSAGGVLVCLWALVTAFIGFVWDVAWHADTGRDRELFTVPHTLILMGLGGMILAAVVAIVLATVDTAETGWRWRRWTIPYSAAPMFLLGVGAVAGFPLDDFWHAVYGIDVTMWSPTHLLMIGGASLSPMAMWLMLREGGAGNAGPARGLWFAMPGIALVGLSTFQLEYDMGFPQWQLLFHPVLIAAAAGVGLVAARVAVGRGGALLAAAVFIGLRGLTALQIGGIVHQTVPHFPLYLAEAASVELAFLGLSRAPVSWRAIAGGALASTLGLAAEWAWINAWFTLPWQPGLVPYLWIAVAAGVVASVIGLAAGQVLGGQRPTVPAPLVGGALVVLAALLVFHLPMRTGGSGQVTVSTTTVGSSRLVVSRYGVPSVRRDVAVDLTVDPPSAVTNADRFDITAWQGGEPVKHLRLVETAPGRYHADGVVPTGGNWKSLVMLERGDEVAAVPVAMVADPPYGLAEIPPPDHRSAAFVPASRLLMREFKGGILWPAYLAIGLFTLMIVVWAASLALAYRAVGGSAFAVRLVRPVESRSRPRRVAT